ncbi:MAG: hypothetical protein FIA99_14115 [Ruminiclostridium sp.]|nr:hypothetical protein [Ruminiclostridium sp.]
MNGWKEFLGRMNTGRSDDVSLKKEAQDNFSVYGVYPGSIQVYEGSFFFIAWDGNEKKLIVFKKSKVFNELSGEEKELSGSRVKVCKLDSANCKVIRRVFSFTNPVSHKGRKITIGLGDRLGLASAGHIRLLKDYDVFPVLAQQSIRELNLTGRTYEDVLVAAAWAVFQEGYTKGFGADGDHLKTAEEVKMALDYGFTMITLDCSEHIRNDIPGLPDVEVEALYSNISGDDRLRLESKYLTGEINIGGAVIKFNDIEFKRIVLIYLNAIKYTIGIYHRVIAKSSGSIDFEMSIDETQTPTAPEAHFVVARELLDAGVEITSLAPRFCGEFQKGIDYRGDFTQFTKEFEIHTKIAEKLGYKLSIHSGSDKFTVFPVIGEKTGGVYHLKTAGTNWLEAVRIIANKNPGLYRRMHEFTLEKLAEAKKYYYISANPANIPSLDKLSDNELPALMNMDDSRQVLHITYGLILLAKNADGSSRFKDEIYTTLNKQESAYYMALEKHIGKHADKLGISTTAAITNLSL